MYSYGYGEVMRGVVLTPYSDKRLNVFARAFNRFSFCLSWMNRGAILILGSEVDSPTTEPRWG